MQGAGQPPSPLLSGTAFPAWAAPSAACGPLRGTVPPARPSPWGGAQWEPHGGAARNSKAFGKGGSPAGWESGSVSSAVSELRSQPQLLPSPELFHAVEQHRVPDTHLPWLTVSPHPPYSRWLGAGS